MRPHSSLSENKQLRIIAEWLDRASRWFEEEVRDNRERDRIEGVSNSAQPIETLTFLRPELDRMLSGFRRTTEILVTMTAPQAASESPPEPTRAATSRFRPHLRVVK